MNMFGGLGLAQHLCRGKSDLYQQSVISSIWKIKKDYQEKSTTTDVLNKIIGETIKGMG